MDAPKLDERDYFRYAPSYNAKNIDTILDWSSWTGSSGGFQGAIEMCNNNGSCRKLEGGVMCPSFRVTKDEKDSTRGRANSLRLALSGQLGKDALFSERMNDTMKLCVSCKACKRECPTGVDMSKMKIEISDKLFFLFATILLGIVVFNFLSLESIKFSFNSHILYMFVFFLLQ